MTREDRELLLKDLCGRLPYGLKVKCEKYPFPVTVLYAGNIDEVKFRETGGIECIYATKPYLFPLSSMTEEQKEEIEDKLIFPSNSNGGWIEILCNGKYEIPFWFVDFCNKNHFDYRGLIPMGLANDATGLSIY